MKEKAVTFGPGGSLVGVLCEPKAAAQNRPAVIIMNSGVVHHVGIGRLHVRLARALAVEGITSLRFDLSMIGDSAPMMASVGLGELVQGNIDSALEEVRSTVGIDRFVLAGLCSGARDALEAARRRGDVIGVVSIDLITDLRTWHYHAVHYGSRLLRWRSWQNTITGSNGTLERIFDKLRGKPPRWDDGIEPGALGLRPPTSRDDLRSGLIQILARGGRVLTAFSGGLQFNYNHGKMLYHALPELAGEPNLRLEFLRDADHIFSDRDTQAKLIACVRDWTVEHFTR